MRVGLFRLKTVRGRLAALMASVLLAFVLLQLAVYVFWYRTRATSELETNLELARAVSMAFRSFVDDVSRQEMTLAEVVSGGSPPELVTRLLEKNIGVYPDITSFYHISPAGYVVASSNPAAIGVYAGDRPYFEQAMATGATVVSDMLTDRVLNRPAFIIAHPILGTNGHADGIMAASINPQMVVHIFQGVRLLPEGDISLFDRQGVRVYTNQPARKDGQPARKDELLITALSGKEAVGRYISTLDHTTRFGAKVPIAGVGWVASASRSVDVANAPVNKTIAYTAAALAVVVTLSALASLRIYRAIVTPLRRLQAQARAVGDGGYVQGVRVPELAEFDELALGFDQAAADIARVQQARQRSLERLQRLVAVSADALAAHELEPLLYRVAAAARELTGAAHAAAALDVEPRRLQVAVPPGAQVQWDSVPRLLADTETARLARETPDAGGGLVAVRLIDAVGACAGFVVVAGKDTGDFSEEDEALLRQLGALASLALQHIQSRMDAELRANEAEEGRRILDALMDNVPEGIAIFDAPATLRMISRYGATHLKCDPAFLAGARAECTAHGADGVTPVAPESMPLWRAIHNGEIVRNEELVVVCPKGEPIRLLCDAGPIGAPEGAVTGGVIVWSDLTGMRASEAERMRLLAILDSTSDLVSFADASCTLQYLNAAARRILGIAADADLSNWPLTKGYPPHAAEIIEQEGIPTAAREGMWQGELALLDHAGREITVSQVITAHRDAQGRPLYYSMTGRDISDLKAAMNALRESEELLRQAVDNYPSVFVIYDAERRFRFLNRQGSVLSGLSASDIVGRRDDDVFSEETTRDYLPILKRAWATRQMQTGEVTLRIHGELHTFVLSYVPLLDAQGNLRQILGIGYEVTQRKRAEEALRRVAEELARSNRDLEQFAYVASHDLQEPLRMITGYLQLIDRRFHDLLDDDGREFINYAVDGSHRMQTLINDLLAYSRVGTRGKPFALTDLTDIVKRVLRNLETVIAETDAAITLLPLPAVMADETQMMQLFQNLLANALKFRDPDRPLQIEIGARQQQGEEGPYWECWVKDNGIGVAPEYNQKIFVIFQRLHGRDRFPGTGIGLALCKKIVERHQGRIWLESRMDEGSTFYFTIGSEGVLT